MIYRFDLDLDDPKNASPEINNCSHVYTFPPLAYWFLPMVKHYLVKDKDTINDCAGGYTHRLFQWKFTSQNKNFPGSTLKRINDTFIRWKKPQSQPRTNMPSSSSLSHKYANSDCERWERAMFQTKLFRNGVHDFANVLPYLFYHGYVNECGLFSAMYQDLVDIISTRVGMQFSQFNSLSEDLLEELACALKHKGVCVQTHVAQKHKYYKKRERNKSKHYILVNAEEAWS
ncbi:hypothetical protein RFI_14766 [Reticulomyxa filosa]|uniref:Uncharacterized protein n=1 Tax=Reticulomyxa filosa TaxID=46433 RepID=X6N8T2_RETFI|nr:hypothetical protein RFI_14766 [Reticulomyxa filosa]|eukprot:ETO22431.1 hypothetical protein RFI_14766 [Reticulomyxa filosa]